VDAHIYTKSLDGSNAEIDHIPGLTEQLGREERPLPTLMISDRIRKLSDIDDLVRSNASTDEILKLFELSGYSDYYPPIRFKPAV
jgi:thymidylate synthase